MAILRNVKHERFAQAIAAGKTHEEAQRIAGYNQDRRNASHVRQRDDVSLRIAEILTQREHAERKSTERAIERTAITKERVAAELAKIGFSNMADYMHAGANGDPYLDFSAITRDQAAALTEFTVETFKDGRGEDARDVRRVKFKLADKRQALMDIAKLFGWLIDRRENREVEEFADMSADALKDFIAGRAKSDVEDEPDATRH